MNPNENRAATVEACEANFESEVLKADQPVVVVFWTPWSRPCHILDAALEEVANECAGSVKLVKVNADDNPDLGLWYDVQAVPTILYFINGSLRAKLVGTASKEAILSKLHSICQNAQNPSLPSK
jgi:thioredoxin 1